MADTATSTATPPASSPITKAERWAASHKVLVGAAGLGGAFLLLSRRGSTQTIQGAAVAPTDETSTDLGSTTDDPAEGAEPDVPIPDEPVPADAPVTPDPVVAPPPVTPAIAVAPPAPAPVTPPSVAKPVLSTVPAQTSPSIAKQVAYDTVPGYYSTIQAYDRKTGDAYEWHHYTSGTRAGDKVRAGFLGNYGKNIRPTGNGWAPGTLGMGDYERFMGSTQYESTQVARVTKP